MSFDNDAVTGPPTPKHGLPSRMLIHCKSCNTEHEMCAVGEFRAAELPPESWPDKAIIKYRWWCPEGGDVSFYIDFDGNRPRGGP